MIRRPPRSTQSRSSAASDVYKRQGTLAACSLATSRPQRADSVASCFSVRAHRPLLIDIVAVVESLFDAPRDPASLQLRRPIIDSAHTRGRFGTSAHDTARERRPVLGRDSWSTRLEMIINPSPTVPITFVVSTHLVGHVTRAGQVSSSLV